MPRFILRAGLWLGILLFATTVAPAAQEKFFNYYENGLRLLEAMDYPRALAEFQAAASLEFEDVKKKRTYGTRFIAYYPHLQLGICYFNLGEAEHAAEQLRLHLAYLPKSPLANPLLEKIERGEGPGPAAVALEPLEDPAPAAPVEDAAAELPPETPPARSGSSFSAGDGRVDRASGSLPGAAAPPSLALELPPDEFGDAIGYSPDGQMQVGSRLSIAVLPFEVEGRAPLTGERAAEALATKLVNLRRFRVIERAALDQIMKEQALNMSGMVDESQAIQLAKLVGADALVMGSLVGSSGGTSVGTRVIDTETGVTLTAHTCALRKGTLAGIDRELDRLAVALYNDLPLLSGSVVTTEGEEVFLDIGGVSGVRKGVKLVAYRAGKPIVHPKTGEELGVQVTQLGELIVIQVQDQMAITKPIGRPDQPIKTGDQVITK